MLRLRGVLAFACALTSAGCFVYVPVGTPAPTGATVRVSLTDSGAAALVPQLGPNVLMVSGVAVSGSGEEVPVAVRSYRVRDFGDRPFDEQVLRLSRGHISSLQMKQLSVARTALFVGAIAGGVFLLDRSLGGGFFGMDDKPGPREIQ